jgi:hypothetical protein
MTTDISRARLHNRWTAEILVVDIASWLGPVAGGHGLAWTGQGNTSTKENRSCGS